MSFLRNYHLHFGLSNLVTEWKNLFTTKYLGNDLIAGMTVAFVAIPLSLAIALASGVSPGAGLVTAIIAGIVCALFGGAPLSVSGPAAAMCILVADTVEKLGVQGLFFVCLLAGFMQLLTGTLGLGRLGRCVPIPVIASFTAGIGVIIIIGQLPRAFGIAPPAESHTLDILVHFKDYFHTVSWTTFGLTLATIAMIRLLPKVFPKLPSILIAVAVTTFVVFIFDFKNIALIGNIPSSLPPLKFPEAPNFSTSEIIFSAFMIYLLASLESLLSTNAIDKLIRAKKHDPNQELVGQGLGNIAVSLFGGIPVTGVIVRSALNISAGAKTRRASIFHSLVIILAVFAMAPLISMIPIAALSGVLFSVAFSMINYREFKNLCRTIPSEAFVYAVTFFTIIFVDLIVGVQAGMIAAGIIVLIKSTRNHLNITSSSKDGMIRFSIIGSLTFLSSNELTDLETKLDTAKLNQTVILDLSGISNLDSSGANAIIDLFNYCKNRSIKFYIKGLPRRFELLVKINGGEEIIEKYYLISENDLKNYELPRTIKSSRERLIHGLQLFYNESKSNDRRLYEYIAYKQDPHTLFITCSDSRIIPTLITSTEPGELFTIRNVGNFIPPYESLPIFSEAAAIEFALDKLNISDIIICGHANCGAIQACHSPDSDPIPNKLKSWIDMMKAQLILDQNLEINEVARFNVLNQIKNLENYPIVKRRRALGQVLNIHGWFLDFEENLVYEWDKSFNKFKPIIATSESSI